MFISEQKCIKWSEFSVKSVNIISIAENAQSILPVCNKGCDSLGIYNNGI